MNLFSTGLFSSSELSSVGKQRRYKQHGGVDSETQLDTNRCKQTKIRQMLESCERGQRNTESKSGGGEDRARSKLDRKHTERLLHTTVKC